MVTMHHMNSSVSQLRPYERHVACLLLGLLAGIGIAAAVAGRQGTCPGVETITIRVVGAVCEKELCVESGATLDDALARIAMREGADTSGLDGARCLHNGEVVVVPYEHTTTVYVTGAVLEPKTVVLEQGAKPRQILEYVQVSSDADVSQVLRKRVLKNGSVIEIKKRSTTRQTGKRKSPSQ